MRFNFSKILIVLMYIISFNYGVNISYAVYYATDNVTNPSCAPGDSGCYVSLLPDQTSKSGSLLFSNGTNPNWTTPSALYWDSVNGRLGLGTITPSTSIDVVGANTTASIGSEIITATADRDFSSDTGNWTGSNWIIGSGVITHTAGVADVLSLASGALSPTIVADGVYQLVFTVTTTTVGTLTPALGGTSGTAVGKSLTTLTYTQTIHASTTASLTFTPSAAWAGTIDNVSIKLITPNSAIQILRNSDSTIGLELRAGGSVSGTLRNNTFLGVDSGLSNTTGISNTASGWRALMSNTTGLRNVAFGSQALSSNTTSSFSTAVGERALTADNGGSNTAVGFFALGSNVTGSSNNAFGRESLEFNIDGTENNAFGNFALSNATGSTNTAFGSQAGRGATSSSAISNNSLFGYAAGLNLITGANNNVFMGYQAGRSVTTGATNIILGSYNSVGITTGSGNIIIGNNAGQGTSASKITTGSYNTFIGGTLNAFSLATSLSNTVILADGQGNMRFYTDSSGKTIIGNINTVSPVAAETLDVWGKLALNGRTAMYYPATSTFANTIFIGNGGSNLTSNVFGDGQLNTAVGIDSMLSITTGYGNTSMGNESMRAVTTGSVSAAFGSHALLNWQTGTDNNAFGVDTLYSLTHASFNNGFGTSVLYATTTGTHNAGFGVDTFYNNVTGNNNTGMGNNAGKNMTGGDNNTFVGYLSAAGSSGSFTSTGSTTLGTSSLQYLSTGGNYNTAIGMNAGLNNTTGTINTYLGYNTGLGITTGSKNTIIGANVTGLSSSLSNNIIIADGDGNQRLKVDNTGALTVSALVSCGGIQTNGSGILSCTSDETLKDITGQFTKGIDAIRNINPISYSWKQDNYLYDNGMIYNGFSAQNVQTALGGDATSLSSDGHLQISQLTLLAASINAIKDLDLKIIDLSSIDLDKPNSVASLVRTFLSDSGNQIMTLYAKTLHSSDKICINNTCINEEQLIKIINSSGAQIQIQEPISQNQEIVDESPDENTEVVPEVTTPEIIPEVIPEIPQEITENIEVLVSPEDTE